MAQVVVFVGKQRDAPTGERWASCLSVSSFRALHKSIYGLHDQELLAPGYVINRSPTAKLDKGVHKAARAEEILSSGKKSGTQLMALKAVASSQLKNQELQV